MVGGMYLIVTFFSLFFENIMFEKVEEKKKIS